MGVNTSMKSLKFILLLIAAVWTDYAAAQRYELNKKDTAEVQWIKGNKFYLYKVEREKPFIQSQNDSTLRKKN